MIGVRSLTTLAIAVALFGRPMRAAEEEHHHGLGSVRFPVSCTPAAGELFSRGVALLHSFWYDEAEKTFRAVVTTDPACAMGYWGIAMSRYHPLWAPPADADLQEGRAAIEQGVSAGARTRRERDYIAALELFYRNPETLNHRSRALAWQRAMQRLSARYPTDNEAATFYALALLATASATDKAYVNQKRAAAILNRVLNEQPDHPGVAHYLIHSYDSPQLAGLALPAARAYARIAPEAPHALHMPSHIFTRLGMWQDSIASNLASAAAARKHAAATSPGATAQDELHAMDYLVYAYIQRGQDEEARKIVEQAAAVSRVDQEVIQAGYALAAIPARFALERRRWSDAAALQVQPSSFPWARFRYAEAITAFARAVGFARSGNASRARQEAQTLAAIRAGLPSAEGMYDWGGQVEIQRQAAMGWLAHAEGNDEKALALMRSAAELEDASDKHPVTPGPVLPARELLGELLMEMNRPVLALREFNSVLSSSPGRFNATYGAARAAELSGDRRTARRRYSQLLQLCAPDSMTRVELQNARAFLAAR